MTDGLFAIYLARVKEESERGAENVQLDALPSDRERRDGLTKSA